MNTIILFWNPVISTYTMERLRADLNVGRHVKDWSVWEHEKAHRSDRFFMVRCGEGKTGICMSGRFCSEPYMGEDWSGKGREVYYMCLMPDVVIEPDLLPILSTEILSREIPSFDWTGGHSGRLLSAEEAEKLEELWTAFLEENSPMFGNLTLKSHVSDADALGIDDDPYSADIVITQDGEFEIHSWALDVKVVCEDLETVKKEFAKKMKAAGKIVPIEFNVRGVDNQELFQKALDIAKEAYCGMKDEYGEPYIKRALKETINSYSDVGILVRLLHYVLKNPKFTTDILIQKEIPKVVVDSLEALHQKEDESLEHYLKRACENPAATDILYDIFENRLNIKEIPELTLDRFTGLAQDLKAYHYLEERRNHRARAVFHGPAKDFDMWQKLYVSADTIAICGEYGDEDVAEMSKSLKYFVWKLDISELNVGRWTKDNPHESTYEEEILVKLGEDGEVNLIEKMILNRKYGTFFEKWGDFFSCDNGRVLVHIPDDYDEFCVRSDVEIIGRCAVTGNQKIEKLKIPDNVKIIDDDAFSYCRKLRRVIMHDGVTAIGESCFECCSIETLRLSRSLTEIPDGAFAHNDIEHVEIPSSVKRIGAEAFFGNLIEKQVVPEGVETIGSSAFTGVKLKYITLPSTLKEIAYDFYYEEMVDDPEEMKPYVEIHPDNPVYYSKGGILYRRDTGKEALGKEGKEQNV